MSSLAGKTTDLLEEKSLPLSIAFGRAAGVILVIMMMITVADAIGRKFGNPIFGVYEAVSFLLGLLFFSSAVYCAAKKRHLVINAVTARFSPKVRMPLITAWHLISTLVSWLLGSQLIIYGFEQKASGATGIEYTFLPTYPFVWATALCFLVLGWVFLVQTIHLLGKATEKNY